MLLLPHRKLPAHKSIKIGKRPTPIIFENLKYLRCQIRHGPWLSNYYDILFTERPYRILTSGIFREEGSEFQTGNGREGNVKQERLRGHFIQGKGSWEFGGHMKEGCNSVGLRTREKHFLCGGEVEFVANK